MPRNDNQTKTIQEGQMVFCLLIKSQEKVSVFKWFVILDSEEIFLQKRNDILTEILFLKTRTEDFTFLL